MQRRGRSVPADSCLCLQMRACLRPITYLHANLVLHGGCSAVQYQICFYLLLERNKIQLRMRNKCKHRIRALNNAFMFKGHYTEVHSLSCYHINTHSTAAYKSPALCTPNQPAYIHHHYIYEWALFFFFFLCSGY